MKQNFDHNGFRDFEYIAGMNTWAQAKMFQSYADDPTAKVQLNYRLPVSSGCGPTVNMNGEELISLVPNDYLGFTQHPLVKQAAIDGIRKYGEIKNDTGN